MEESERSLGNVPYLCGQYTNILEQEQSFDRVQQWLINQDDYVAFPPPDRCSVASIKSNSDLNSDEFRPYKYRSDGHIDKSRYNDIPAGEYLNFRKIESRRYYSPNLNRRRPNGSRESNINKIFGSTTDALDKFGNDCKNEHLVDNYLEPQTYSDKVNTFPRRHKVEKTQPPIPSSLLQKSSMGQQLEKYYSPPYRMATTHSLSNSKPEKKSIKPDGRSKARLFRPKSWNTDTRPTYVANNNNNSSANDIQNDSGNCLDISSNSMMGNMSLDTQRLFTSNLPDVALTAAKALHKRELSDSINKIQFSNDTVHIRMSSAPETSIEKYGTDSSRKRVPAIIRKVKAFSWPKRAVIQSFSLPQYEENKEVKSVKTLNKAESGYNTEKSEDKADAVPAESNNEKDCPSEGCSSSDIPPERPPLPLLKSLKKSFSNRSYEASNHEPSVKLSADVNSCDISDKQKIINGVEVRNTTCENMNLTSNEAKSNTPDSTSYSYESVSNLSHSPVSCTSITNPITIDCKISVVSPAKERQHAVLHFPSRSLSDKFNTGNILDQGVPKNSDKAETPNNETFLHDVRHDVTDFDEPDESDPTTFDSIVEPIAAEISETFGENDDVASQSSDNCNTDSDFELSKSASMSLRDLIRIHEQEIARVSGQPKSKKKSACDEKRRSCMVETNEKPEISDHWKRHTTIGLLGDHQIIDESSLSQHIPPSTGDEQLITSPECEFQSEQTHSRVNSSLASLELVVKSPRSSSLNSNTFSKNKTPPPISIKPKKSISSAAVSTSCSSAQDKSENLKSPSSVVSHRSAFFKDMSVQTLHNEYLVNCKAICENEAGPEVFENEVEPKVSLYEDQILYLTMENQRLKEEFQAERVELSRKLEEQKKVANAYQKLEDRYRRKVFELTKHFQMCSCNGNNLKHSYVDGIDESWNSRNFSAYYQIEDRHHDSSVDKVDGILHQLEAWLNNQTNSGMVTDTSEVSSLLESITDEPNYTRYKLTDHYASPPLEIIDQIDATSV